ncbi:MAG: S41 family peptidase [Clostridiales Family XIII bacterium]|jgi:carboxyl-terminal processing protease|nr:S41 family peptidase [Clostridiales Family XIII bacterium]
MNPFKMRKFAKVVALIIVAAMVITSVMALITMGVQVVVFGADGDAAADAYLDARAKYLKEYVKLIARDYKDNVDYKLLMDGAFAGVADILGDPYSEYYLDIDKAKDFLSSANGLYEGVGVSVEVTEAGVRVISALPGSPAAKAGIRSGDVLVEVDGASLAGKTEAEALAMLRGPVGAPLKLLVRRDGADVPFSLVRDVVRATSVYYGLTRGGIGYVQITSFDDDTDKEFLEARDALSKQGASALVLDLRDNPGGVMETMLNVADMLLPPGATVTHLTRKGLIRDSYKTPGKNYKKMPLAVLVNGGSASASEMLAAALQDNKAAVLVGTTTYGKGVGQTVADLDDGGILKLSTFYFLSPNKRDIDKAGVTPDYIVDIPTEPKAGALMEAYKAFAPMTEKTKPALGDVGLNVFGAQQRLKLMGHAVPTNAAMDGATASAVARFQSAEGLYSYGVLDYSTARRLDAACLEFIARAGKGADTQMAKAAELLEKSVD